MLTSDKFYRSFVLLPCEICVVPFGHRKIAADWNDITLAKMKSTVVGLTHACASLCSFKRGYLSLQKYSLTFPTSVLRLKVAAANFTA